jgi:hypothetical protein
MASVRDAFKNLRNKVRASARQGVENAANKFSAGGGVTEMVEEATHEAMKKRSSKIVGNIVEKELDHAFRPNIFKRAGKKAGIAALVIGGVAALGVAASNMRKNRGKLPPRDNSDLDALAASIPDTLPAGPADGRAPDEWQSRVRPGAQPARGPVNPAMNVGPDVQDLGAPPSRA